VLAPRVERALVTLATHAQQLDGRIATLERRLDAVAIELRDADVHLPTHDDLLEVRMHSAKVAAELARVSIELRSEIARVADNRDRRNRRINTLAEQIIDLSDSLDTRPGDLNTAATG
jgi:chromosome segregation ATPase